MRVGLHRIQHVIDGAQTAQRTGGGANHRRVVDIGTVVPLRQRQQLGAPRAPPRFSRCRRSRRWREQLLPGRAEHRAAAHRTDQALVQVVDQAVALLFVDHEGEVEVVGRLAEQVHALLREQLEGLAELLQDGADVAPDQAHRCTGPEDLRPAELGQVRQQRLEYARIERIRGRVERYRHVGLGGGNQVDRQAVTLEELERIGQESDLVPHSRAVQRDQRDALLDAHRLDLRGAIAELRRRCACLRARALGRVDGDRDLQRLRPAGCSADAAPWRRCSRSPAPRRSAARAAAAPAASSADSR